MIGIVLIRIRLIVFYLVILLFIGVGSTETDPIGIFTIGNTSIVIAVITIVSMGVFQLDLVLSKLVE